MLHIGTPGTFSQVASYSIGPKGTGSKFETGLTTLYT